MALDLNDKTSNGNNLTNNNSATEYTTSLPFSQSTSAVAFASASSQYLSAADSASLDLATTGTIEFWINFASTPSSGTAFVLIAKDNQSTQRSFSIFLRNVGGSLKLEALILGNSTDDYYRWDWTPSTDTWYHVAVTIDTGNASATTFEAFINGVSQGNGTSVDAGNVTTITNSTASLTIGASGAPGEYVNGRMDDVRIWNTVRTGTQIANNRSIELTGSESGLVAYYPFEASLGATAGAAFLLNFV